MMIPMCGPSCQQGWRRGHLIVKTRQRNSVFLTDAKRRVSFPRVPAPAASCPRAGKSGGHAGSGRRQLRLGVAQGTGGHGDPPNQGILIDTGHRHSNRRPVPSTPPIEAAMLQELQKTHKQFRNLEALVLGLIRQEYQKTPAGKTSK